MRATHRSIALGWSLLIAGIALLLAACGDDSDKPRPSQPTSDWAIGAPERQSTGTTFAIPERGMVNYVTRSTGSLAGKTRITLRYRVDMAEGVRIFPASVPEQQSILTLYVQQKDDDWTAKGDYNFYRWYATSRSRMPIEAGEHVVTAHLVDHLWTAVKAGESFLTDHNIGMVRNPRFDEALAKADRIGFVMGGGTGYGHGVSATGPATFTIVSFTVE